LILLNSSSSAELRRSSNVCASDFPPKHCANVDDYMDLDGTHILAVSPSLLRDKKYSKVFFLKKANHLPTIFIHCIVAETMNATGFAMQT